MNDDGRMLPSFMGDSGFNPLHLHDWNAAELRVGIKNVAAASSRSKAAPSLPTRPDVNARVPPSYTKATSRCTFSRKERMEWDTIASKNGSSTSKL